MKSIATLLLAITLVVGGEDAVPKPRLLHASKGCFVHALPASPECSRGYVERTVAPGWQLLHTSRETGAMTVLLPATGVIAVSTRRISYQVTRIMGVVADAERLYVLTWRARMWDKPPAADALIEAGSYRLLVFWLADGSALAAPALKPEGLPKAASAESLEPGPLRIMANGLEVLGTQARYKGRDLLP